VDAVRQHELAFAADPLQQEGDEDRPVALCQAREDGAERLDVARPQVGGQLHARHHQNGVRVAALDPVQYLLQGLLRVRQRHPPQAVVAPQLQDEHVHLPAQDPVDAAQTRCRGLAAQTGVDDLKVPAQRIDAGLNDRWIGLFLADAVSGGEAVAEEEDHPAGIGRGGPGEARPEQNCGEDRQPAVHSAIPERLKSHQ